MSWIRVASVDELTDDVPLAVDVPVDGDELPLAIVRHQGALYAIWNECSHGNVELSEGDVADGAIECYLHGSRFSLATGEPLTMPATQPVRVFPARIDGDDVLVDVANPTEDF